MLPEVLERNSSSPSELLVLGDLVNLAVLLFSSLKGSFGESAYHMTGVKSRHTAPQKLTLKGACQLLRKNPNFICN